MSFSYSNNHSQTFSILDHILLSKILCNVIFLNPVHLTSVPELLKYHS